jgi:hypothetical protein
LLGIPQLISYNMEAFGGDSPLSEAPTSASGSPPKPDIKSKAPSPLKTKKQANVASSRRSSRIEDRSQSPDKPVVSRIGTTGLKFKLARHPSPEKPDNADKVDKEMGDEKRGKKRKSEPKAGNEGVVEEAREAMGQKKAKITHETQSEVKEEEEGPKKKNVAVKKKKGKSEKSSNDLLADLFSDGEDDEAFRGNEKEEEIVAKPMIKIKQGKAKGKAKVEKVEGDGDGDVVMGEPQPESPLPATTSIGKKSSKARRGEEEEFKPEGGPPEATEPSSFTTKSKSKSGRLIKKAPSDDFIEEPSVPKAKGKKKNGQSKDTSVSSQPNPSETTQKGTPDTIPAPEDKATTSTTDPAAAPSKPKKSYAQTVVGSPVPSSDALPTKKVTKSIPATTKFTNTQQSGPSSSVSTPDKKSMSTPTGSTIKKVTPAPVQVKKPQPVKEVSLLESTMASLLGGHTGLNSTTKSTPKKEVSSPCPYTQVEMN